MGNHPGMYTVLGASVVCMPGLGGPDQPSFPKPNTMREVWQYGVEPNGFILALIFTGSCNMTKEVMTGRRNLLPVAGSNDYR